MDTFSYFRKKPVFLFQNQLNYNTIDYPIFNFN